MKTGIEKFENAMNPDVCDLLIKHLEDNLHNSLDLNHSNKKPTVAFLYFLFMISILFFNTKFIKSYINKKVL